MTPENFCYWLQGYFELRNEQNLTEEQVKVVKDHLNLVFNKVTPERGPAPSPRFCHPAPPPPEIKDCQMFVIDPPTLTTIATGYQDPYLKEDPAQAPDKECGIHLPTFDGAKKATQELSEDIRRC